MEMPRPMRALIAAAFRVPCSCLQPLAAVIKVSLWCCWGLHSSLMWGESPFEVGGPCLPNHRVLGWLPG